jgi:ATP-dependent DNA helicase PIF1
MTTLTEDQQAAFDAIQEGRNVFLTGPAGTGKSYLLHYILDHMKGKRIVLTAMTGCAALLISTQTHKAKTLHSWAGIGLGKESATELCKKIRASYHSHKRWMCIDMLVIDEISMMSPELLEKLNTIAKTLRKSQKPFGGIQVLFVGDFYQLPPVTGGTFGTETAFAFETPQWDEIIECSAHLTTISRQKDPQFQSLLNETRNGKLSKKSIELLKSRMIAYDTEEIKPTLLFSRRADVDRINEKSLAALTGDRQTYDVRIVLGPKAGPVSSTAFEEFKKRAEKDAQYSVKLELAVGAQVMLIVNLDMDGGLVNGSRGIVVGFEGGYPLVKFRNGLTEKLDRHSWSLDDNDDVFHSQIPLRLAYAVSIHKAQGATLDCALIDVGPSTFEYGQAYVALSRVKSIDSLYIKAFDPRVIKAHPKVIQFYEESM